MELDSYLVVDTETTGPISSIHSIVLLGLLHKTLKEPVTDASPLDIYIQTPYEPKLWGAVYLYNEFLDELSQYTKLTDNMVQEIDANNGSIMGTSVPLELQSKVDDKGKKCYRCAYDIHGISAQQTIDQGVPRKDAMEMLYSTLMSAKRNRLPLVGHNIVRFDIPFIQMELSKYNMYWEPDPELIVDTGALVKARRIGMPQKPRESNIDYYHRVANTRAKGVVWSLDEYCVPTFGLDKMGVDTNRQHASAGYDCFVTHCLLQKL